MVSTMKGIIIPCPKCGRRLLQMCFTGILLAPQTGFMVLCGQCNILINVAEAFPGMFHIATKEELLPTTVPLEITQGEVDKWLRHSTS